MNVAKVALFGMVICALLALIFLLPSAMKAGEGIASAVDSMPAAGSAAWDVDVFMANAVAELPAIPREKVASHSEWAHDATDVEAIRQCYDGGNPPFQLWREKDKITYHCLFQLPDGRLGDRIIAKDGKSWFERTSFVPKDGSWRAILDWLTRKGASRYNGPLP